jgi:hypothetical protein
MKRICGRILWAAALLLLVSCTAKEEALRPPPPSPARIEVVQLQMTANRDFVGVKFRLAEGDRVDFEKTEVFLIDESTGDKYTVVRLQRIGRIAEFSVPGEEGIHHVMFRNREGRLKVGKRVTIVVGNARHEHLEIRP